MASTSDIRRVARPGRGWLSTQAVLMLALAGAVPNALAGTSVVAWGAGKTINPGSTNDYGQSIVPANLTNAVQVAAGWRQSLAVKADGTLQGWGDDTLGQITFPPGSNYLCVACGDLHSLALKSDGTVVVADAYDFYGQADVPANLSNVVAVACGYYHCLALKSDGTVAAWGGQGSVDYGQGAVPAGLSNVVAIAAGGYHNLVLKSDGTLFAWGGNDYGQATIPTGLSNMVAIAAGGFYNLSLRTNGIVAAWGFDGSGQTDVPSDLSNVVAIAAKGDHSLALKTNGTVVAWGLNTEGDTNVPSNLSNVVQVATGDFNCLALVRTNPPMTLTVMVRSSLGTNGFNVTVPTQNGRVYQLQYKNSLMNNVWQSLPLAAGTGGLLQLTDSAVATQRFYRVMQW